MRFKYAKKGFALPSVVVASIILLGMLALALQLSTTADGALKDQYYNQLAREAAESGVKRASSCLRGNNSLAQWTNTKLLKTGTDCKGDIVSGQPLYMSQDSVMRTSFEVKEPTRVAGVAQRVPSVGRVELLTPGGRVFKTYTYHSSSMVAANTLISEVAFGYNAALTCNRGAYFLTISDDTTVKGAGLNSCGQLGNGTLTDSTGLRKFLLPAGKIPSKVFTSFVSEGRNSFVLTADGEVYGAGYNEDGEIGNGRNDFYPDWHGHLAESIPQRYNMDAYPDDKKIVHVIPNGYATFVITEKGNVYVSGYSGNGSLGIGWNNTNSYKDLPVKVQIPAGEQAQTQEGTWATKSWYFDKYANFIVAKSGKVYAWGDNTWGELGQGDYQFRTVPTQVGVFGNPGQPKAKRVAFDRKTAYILDEEGNVYSSGSNPFGQVGTRTSMLQNKNTGRCLAADGHQLTTQNCSPTAQNQKWTFQKDGTIKVNANPGASSKLCLSSKTSGNWKELEMAACNASGANYDYQQFGPQLLTSPSRFDSVLIKNMSWNAHQWCLGEAQSGKVTIDYCDEGVKNRWWPHVTTFQKVNFPGNRKAVSIMSDYLFATAVMSDGTVFSWGMNNGALGNGQNIDMNDLRTYSKHIINWDPVQFQLPAGVKAVSAWSVSSDWSSDKANTYIIGDDCRVYGAGSNTNGQLGIGVFGGGSSGIYFTPQQMKVVGVGNSGCPAYVRSGYGTTVIYTSNRKVFTVGNNSNGQLGDGMTNNSAIPMARQLVNMSSKMFMH